MGIKTFKHGNFKKARDYFQLALNEAKEGGNKGFIGTVYNNLGLAYESLGEFRKAIEFYQVSLPIAIETGNKDLKCRVYNNLGLAYQSLGEVKRAVEFFQLSLPIAIETGDKGLKGIVYNNLGSANYGLGEFRRAIGFFQLSLPIAIETGNKDLQCRVYNNLGLAYKSLGEFKRAIEFFRLSLPIAIETGNKDLKCRVYNSLGSAYSSLGDSMKEVEFYQLSLPIAIETGNKGLKGTVYNNLGGAHLSLGDFRKAFEFYQLSLSLAIETGRKDLKGTVYSNLGVVRGSLGDFRKAIDFFQLSLLTAIETGDKDFEGRVYNNLGHAYEHLGDVRKAIEFCQTGLNVLTETGNKVWEAASYHHLAWLSFLDGDLFKAEESCKSSIKLFEEVRALLQGKDGWKIMFRDEYDKPFTLLWQVQLRQGKILEALFTAEAGRAQALMDLMNAQYGVRKSIWSPSEQGMELIMSISSLLSSPTLFLAKEETNVQTMLTFWLLLNGKEGQNIQEKINGSLTSLIHQTYENIGVKKLVRSKPLKSQQEDEGAALKRLYDLVIAPVSHLIKGDELIIVPDRSAFLIPYAALVNQHSTYLSETLRIRLFPSLTSLRLLAECPESHHSTSGALLVGNPWVETVRIKDNKPFPQLAGAEQEAEMIGQILNIKPLTGKNATKDQVLRRLNSVSLVHIAAHGCPETGEIILTPNLTDAIRPKEEDFLLTMADVLDLQLRAKLVVLSCCYSARGKINAEGVVGIARAFLGAGARSVIASLWALSDEATLEFMKHFYGHLVAGQSASKSLHHAMKWMRESEEFKAVKYWAPFVLIGDDVTLNFESTKGEALPLSLDRTFITCQGMRNQNFNLCLIDAVRVIGGMSLRNGMWHGLRNNIIM